jgi:hypothetical protein
VIHGYELTELQSCHLLTGMIVFSIVAPGLVIYFIAKAIVRSFRESPRKRRNWGAIAVLGIFALMCLHGAADYTTADHVWAEGGCLPISWHTVGGKPVPWWIEILFRHP